ncbi:MAG: hypothetical protein RJQ09_16485 [Cyclobacteriaceae bacterium]
MSDKIKCSNWPILELCSCIVGTMGTGNLTRVIIRLKIISGNSAKKADAALGFELT